MQQTEEKIKPILNGHTDTYLFLNGIISQNEYARRKGIGKSSIKGQLAEIFERELKEAFDKVFNIHDRMDSAEQKQNSMRTEMNALRTDMDTLRTTLDAADKKADTAVLLREKAFRERDEAEQLADSLQKKVDTLEQAAADAERVREKLERERDEAVSRYEQWMGQIKAIRCFRGKAMKFTLSVMLVVLDAFCISSLLSASVHSPFVSIPVGIGLALSLLTFTVSNNRNGRFFSIALSFLAAGLYFDIVGSSVNIWQSGLEGFSANAANIVFSLVPPLINAILSEMLNGND